MALCFVVSQPDCDDFILPLTYGRLMGVSYWPDSARLDWLTQPSASPPFNFGHSIFISSFGNPRPISVIQSCQLVARKRNLGKATYDTMQSPYLIYDRFRASSAETVLRHSNRPDPTRDAPRHFLQQFKSWDVIDPLLIWGEAQFMYIQRSLHVGIFPGTIFYGMIFMHMLGFLQWMILMGE